MAMLTDLNLPQPSLLGRTATVLKQFVESFAKARVAQEIYNLHGPYAMQDPKVRKLLIDLLD